MQEAGVVILKSGPPIWHLPEGRSGGYLPDSQDLWDILWANRQNLLGFAHSHPGSGAPSPSYEDLTTFRAVEAALGVRLSWWITSADTLLLCRWDVTHGQYAAQEEGAAPAGFEDTIQELRKHSSYTKSLTQLGAQTNNQPGE